MDAATAAAVAACTAAAAAFAAAAAAVRGVGLKDCLLFSVKGDLYIKTETDKYVKPAVLLNTAVAIS